MQVAVITGGMGRLGKSINCIGQIVEDLGPLGQQCWHNSRHHFQKDNKG